MEVKIAPFIHDMKNLCQDISLFGNSFVNVLAIRENKSHKMLIIFYRTASKTKLRMRRNRPDRTRWEGAVSGSCSASRASTSGETSEGVSPSELSPLVCRAG